MSEPVDTNRFTLKDIYGFLLIPFLSRISREFPNLDMITISYKKNLKDGSYALDVSANDYLFSNMVSRDFSVKKILASFTSQLRNDFPDLSSMQMSIIETEFPDVRYVSLLINYYKEKIARSLKDEFSVLVKL